MTDNENVLDTASPVPPDRAPEHGRGHDRRDHDHKSGRGHGKGRDHKRDHNHSKGHGHDHKRGHGHGKGHGHKQGRDHKRDRDFDSEFALDVQDLVVNYILENETVEAVNGVTLRLKKGQTLGLVGETGAGKTSTALAILNLIPTPPGVIKSGAVNVCGNDILSMTAKQLERVRGKDVSMIFQDPMTALNPVMTVGEQIAESIRYHEGLSQKASMEKAADLLELVGIPGVRGAEFPHQFSGGMKQRVVIAIALACSPQVLLADEPTSALDVTIQAQVLDMMHDLKKKFDMALVMITHDLGVVAKVCDLVAVMYAGKIVEYGTLRDVFNNPLHPYTEGLFNSLPNVRDRKAKLIPIPGLMPDPTKLPPGCAFQPRCKYATDVCREPCAIKSVSDTHSLLCARYGEPDFRIELKQGGQQNG